MSSGGGFYLFGYSAEEAERLRIQHLMLSARTTALWTAAGLDAHDHDGDDPAAPASPIVLDLCCGPGLATRDLEVLLGQRTRVIGVDASPQACAAAREAGCKEIYQARVEDLASLPDLKPESLDAVYCRYGLSYILDARRAIATLASLLKPSGVLILQDFLNYHTAPAVYPRNDALLETISTASADSIAHPSIGAELPRMLEQSKLAVEFLDHYQPMGRPHSIVWRWRRCTLRVLCRNLEQRGKITADQAREGLRRFDDLGTTAPAQGGAAFVLGAHMVEIIARKKRPSSNT